MKIWQSMAIGLVAAAAVFCAAAGLAEGTVSDTVHSSVQVSVMHEEEEELTEIADDAVPLAAPETGDTAQTRRVILGCALVLITGGCAVILAGEKKKTRRMESNLKAGKVQ